jgi:hypothetical protein
MRHRTEHSFPDAVNVLRAFGIDVPATFADVCAIYRASGFLYPQKSEPLEAFWPSIRQLWMHLMRVNPSLLIVGIERHHKRSTGAMWKSSTNNWFVQHLASDGDAFGTASLVMGAAAALYLPCETQGFQVWFRGDNKFPNRVFGMDILDGGGRNPDSALHTYNYCRLQKSDMQATQRSAFDVICCDDTTASIATSLISEVRGTAFANVEEFGRDPFLAGIDSEFRREGLRRYRRIYVAFRQNVPVGCAIAFRGPLGLNFSFLENRCDLVLKPGLPLSETAAITEALLYAAREAYADFEPAWIPVTTEVPQTQLPLSLRPLRVYTQAIYLRAAMPRFYDGLRGLYGRLLSRQMKQDTAAMSTDQRESHHHDSQVDGTPRDASRVAT